MRKEDALSNIKSRFQGEISIHDKKEREYDEKRFVEQMLFSIYDYLSTGDIDYIVEQRLQILSHFKLAYSEPLDVKMEEQFLNLVAYYQVNRKKLSDKDMEEFYSKLQHFTDRIKNDLETIKQENIIRKRELDQSEETVKLARDVIRFFKSKNRIYGYTVSAIDYYMKEIGMDDTERVLVREAIRLHNLSIEKNRVLRNSIAEDMINDTIDYFEITQDEHKKYGATYKESSLKIFDDIEKLDTSLYQLEEIVSYFPNHNDCEFGQFNYMFKIILNEIVKKIKQDIADIQNIDYYNDDVMRNVILMSYKDYVRKFNIINFYYQEELKKYNTIEKENLIEITGISKEEETKELHPDRKLVFYYATTKSGISYVERDLKDIPEEKYSEVKDLLEGKMYGTLNPLEDETFPSNNSKFHNYSKLKGDQIRIVYRSLGQGKILILGAFVKKDTRDYSGYERCTRRDEYIDFEDTESIEVYESDALEIEERLFEYIEKYSRKRYR